MKLLSAALILTILVFATYGISLIYQPVSLKNIVINIEPGTSAREIAVKLLDQKVIKSRNLFYLYILLNGWETELAYGRYLFSGYLSMIDVARMLKTGKVIQYKVTIPEGLRLEEVSRIFAAKELVEQKKFLELCYDKEFIKSLIGLDIISLEGFLYPDTYLFPSEVDESFIITHLVREFFRRFDKLSLAEDRYLSFYETIILASIVEKESYILDEKPVIAGVYLNRLKMNMKLQADPTVSYILEMRRRKRTKIYYKDLMIDSPYNTYLYFGLPPSPICSPTISSIKAILAPADTDYLFFFAGENGRHIFSRNYKQHLSKMGRIE